VVQRLNHLRALESESIHIIREVAARFEKPAMMFSIGKDSMVMLRLAQKAFFPGKVPFPLLHVNTTWKFKEMISFRDAIAKDLGLTLIEWINRDGVEKNINPFDHGTQKYTHIMKTEGLRQAIDHWRFTALLGGARRDEERSRAKERVFSHRDKEHRWDPKNQRPELWRLYNTHLHKGEEMRVFPLSNWTELDVWLYAFKEQIPLVPLYFAKERPIVERDGALIMVDDERMRLKPNERPKLRKVRFRTLGCYPLSGAIESNADSLAAVVEELIEARSSERQGRVIDYDEAGSMEDKKREGYF
jgi:sulfate adenylyltransferase subunit 2